MLAPDPRFKPEQDVALLPLEGLKEVAGQESWRNGSEIEESSSYDDQSYGEDAGEYDDFVQDAPEGGWE